MWNFFISIIKLRKFRSGKLFIRVYIIYVYCLIIESAYLIISLILIIIVYVCELV